MTFSPTHERLTFRPPSRDTTLLVSSFHQFKILYIPHPLPTVDNGLTHDTDETPFVQLKLFRRLKCIDNIMILLIKMFVVTT